MARTKELSMETMEEKVKLIKTPILTVIYTHPLARAHIHTHSVFGPTKKEIRSSKFHLIPNYLLSFSFLLKYSEQYMS